MPSKGKKLPKIEAEKRALEKQFERPYVACALKASILVQPKPNATPYTGVCDCDQILFIVMYRTELRGLLE